MARLPKRPKRPKMSSSLTVWKNYDEKMKNWTAKCKALKEAPKKKEAIANRWR